MNQTVKVKTMQNISNHIRNTHNAFKIRITNLKFNALLYITNLSRVHVSTIHLPIHPYQFFHGPSRI